MHFFLGELGLDCESLVSFLMVLVFGNLYTCHFSEGKLG
jgi:hypothetical protein